jgi:hypothetical protein
MRVPPLRKWREAWLGRVVDAVHLAVVPEPVTPRPIRGHLSQLDDPVEPASLRTADGTGRVRRWRALPRRHLRRLWGEIGKPQQHRLAVRVGQRLAVRTEHTHPGVGIDGAIRAHARGTWRGRLGQHARCGGSVGPLIPEEPDQAKPGEGADDDRDRGTHRAVIAHHPPRTACPTGPAFPAYRFRSTGAATEATQHCNVRICRCAGAFADVRVTAIKVVIHPARTTGMLIWVILPKVRDPRLITIRRGGTLTDADHHLLALWAAQCAEHVLHFFEDDQPLDTRPREAIEAARAWARGDMKMMDARARGGHAMGAANPLVGAARYAAYAAGQAACVGHVSEHDLGAAAYAIKAVRAVHPRNPSAGRVERDWQRDQLHEQIRALVLEDQARRNAICWFVFED